MSLTTECLTGLRLEPGPGGTVTFHVEGDLDAHNGRLLLEAVEQARGCSRITVDLSRVERFTEAGIVAATRCWRAGSHLPLGLSYVAAAGPSRRALLAILDRR